MVIIYFSIIRNLSDFSHINKAHQEGIPVIQFDRIDDRQKKLPSVSIDDEKLVYMRKHLIDSGNERT